MHAHQSGFLLEGTDIVMGKNMLQWLKMKVEMKAIINGFFHLRFSFKEFGSCFKYQNEILSIIHGIDV